MVTVALFAFYATKGAFVAWISQAWNLTANAGVVTLKPICAIVLEIVMLALFSIFREIFACVCLFVAKPFCAVNNWDGEKSFVAALPNYWVVLARVGSRVAKESVLEV